MVGAILAVALLYCVMIPIRAGASPAPYKIVDMTDEYLIFKLLIVVDNDLIIDDLI